MSDLIDRQKAIDAVLELSEKMSDEMLFIDAIVDEIENIPSVEPERNRKFLEIVTEYPKICAYPEYEGKPYYSIKYEENGETIVGFGTYKPDVLSQYLREYFISSAEPERKKGEWEVHDYAFGRERYECAECKGKCDLEYNFCPHCGADMTR